MEDLSISVCTCTIRHLSFTHTDLLSLEEHLMSLVESIRRCLILIFLNDINVLDIIIVLLITRTALYNYE